MKQYGLFFGTKNNTQFLARQLHRRHPEIIPVYCSYKTPGHFKHYCRLRKGEEITAIKEFVGDDTVVMAVNLSESFIGLHSRVVSHFNIPGPNNKAVRYFRDKAALHQLMDNLGLLEHRPHTTIVSLPALTETLKKSSYPVVVKPNIGSKSRGIFVVTHPGEASIAQQLIESHFATEKSLLLKYEPHVLLEAYIEGTQITPTCYVDANGKVHIFAYADVLNGRDLGLQHQQLIYRTTPSSASFAIQEKISSILQQVVLAAGLTSTLMHPDFFVVGNEVYLFEINVRIGGFRYEMNKYAFAMDLRTIALELALGEQVTEHIREHSSCTGVEVWEPNSGTVQEIKLPETADIVSQTLYLKPGDTYVAPPLGNKPLARFFVKTPSDSLERAQELRANTHIRITQ